jgi:Zn-dependent protease
VAKREGMGVKEIELYLFGGISKFEREPDSPGSEVRMALSGPLVSFILFLSVFVLARLGFFSYPGLLRGLIECLSVVNLMLFLYNMVPGFPLDGGRVLRALLWWTNDDLKKATRIASSLGKLFGTGFILLGIYLLIKGAVFLGMWLAFIGLFLRSCARESYEETLKRVVLQGAKVKDVMTRDVISVPGALPIEALVHDYFLAKNHIAYFVSDGERAVGIVTMKAVAQAARDQQNGKKFLM